MMRGSSRLLFAAAKKMQKLFVHASFVSTQSGSSLVAVLVATAIMGIIATVMATMNKNMSSFQSKTELGTAKQQISLALMTNVDCKKSIDPFCPGGTCEAGEVATCPTDGQRITLYRKTTSGNVVSVASSGTAIGKWTATAQCFNNAGVDVRVARPRPGTAVHSLADGDYFKDPLNGSPLSFNAANAKVFPPGAFLCQQYFTQTAGNVFTSPPGFACNAMSPDKEQVLCYGALDIDNAAINCMANPPPGCTGYHYQKQVQCPAGYAAMGGGGFCQFTNFGGFQLESHPWANGWFVDCCAYHCPGVYAATYPYAFATCQRVH